MAQLKLNWCSHEAAKYAVEKWHYSHNLPRGKNVKVGVWEDEVFIGVVLFSMGASCSLHKKYGLGQLEVCELSRVALREHQTPVTRIVAIALRMLKKHCPGLRLVVSFADPHEGHVGGIYQGGNWLYTGTSGASTIYIDKAGKAWHSRNVADHDCRGNDWWGTTRRNKQGMRKEARPGKYRYLMPLDTEMRKRVEPLAQPYPSAGSADSGTVGDQSARGGATPTSALLTNEETCREDQHQHPQT